MLRILLVDDHSEFLLAAIASLAKEPDLEIVGGVDSGEKAVGEAARLTPDLVLLDWSLPGMTGPQVLTALKRLRAAPRVIMLTHHDHPRYRTAATQLGADGFVSKADFDTLLLDQIKQVFR